MGYFIDPQGNYPRHAGDVQIEYPSWVEGVDSLPEGWIDVAEGVIPQVTKYQYFIEVKPKQVNGVFVRQFEVIDMTDEQKSQVDALNA